MRIHHTYLIYQKRTRSNVRARAHSKEGFTAVELLVITAVIGILTGLTVSSIIRGSESSKRIQCLRNLRHMTQGTLMYAENDSLGQLIGYLPTLMPPSAAASDDLSYLHGWGTNYPSGYIADLKTFICPSSQNRIRTNTVPRTSGTRPIYVVTDLTDNAITRTSFGHSYEVLSTHGSVRKTTRTVLSYQNRFDPASIGVIPGPSRSFLFYDAMDVPPLGNDNENYPSPGYSHGMSGANVGFADGHSEWIGVADWNYRWNLSQDSNRPLTQ